MLTVDHLLIETAIVTMRIPNVIDGELVRNAHGAVQYTEWTRSVPSFHFQRDHDENEPIAGETFDAFFPPEDPLTATDSVSYDGVSFEVIGIPARWRNPRTDEYDRVQATLRRTTG